MLWSILKSWAVKIWTCLYLSLSDYCQSHVQATLCNASVASVAGWYGESGVLFQIKHGGVPKASPGWRDHPSGQMQTQTVLETMHRCVSANKKKTGTTALLMYLFTLACIQILFKIYLMRVCFVGKEDWLWGWLTKPSPPFCSRSLARCCQHPQGGTLGTAPRAPTHGSTTQQRLWALQQGRKNERELQHNTVFKFSRERHTGCLEMNVSLRGLWLFSERGCGPSKSAG